MAPKRKEKNPSSSPPPVISQRVTRSSTAAKREAQSEIPAEQPAKKSKTTAGKGKAKVTGGGKGKSEASKVAAKEEVKPSGDDVVEQAHGSYRTILIEACKQCTSFKKRALIMKEGLENGIPGITVEINPDKPRRGCFEIRDSGGEIFLSLQKMTRPFSPMKNLEMDEVVKDIVQKIQALP